MALTGEAPKHDWSLPDKRGRLDIEDENEYASAAAGAPVLDVAEAERYAEALSAFDVTDVGSSAWLDQHQRLVKLNLQAHQSAMARADEYVLEALQTFGKVPLLVRELLLVEAWKEFALPDLLKSPRLRSGRCNMRLYFTLYHEATVANLLEAALYRRHACAEAGDALVDLVDYCVRKIVLLNSTRRFSKPKPEAADAKALAAELEERDPVKELLAQADDVEFRCCVTAVTMLRFICEHIAALPLGVATRLLDTHDVLLGIVPLIENPPWTRRLDSGKWQKFIDFKWQDVKPADLLKLTRLEAQVWLALFHLVTQPECRRRYHINAFRKAALLRARRYVNDVLLDQLPVLADVQRFMDELAIADVPEPSQDPVSAGLLMEQVPQVRETIVRGRDWAAVAAQQIDDVFGRVEDATDPDLRRIGQLYQDDALESILDPAAAQ
ncbi:hypothetical protein JKP88DRAFT_271291 [Tribonema minus]|uniref:Uncharacterized protein n=1 Tax=Tribonema minus TaxID=303371 RepID=A0A835ZG21_9STRA|nr:hypothetical protein JKP88DRAFT_271291 [Tribonema minus]